MFQIYCRLEKKIKLVTEYGTTNKIVGGNELALALTQL